MLNSNIKIDLHIHSKASEYKDPKHIVENSKKENITILLDKLIAKDVKLFSITDHNRFDKELYEEINLHLSQCKYRKNIFLLPGVEFDVLLEEDMRAAHIVTIFDCKCEEDYFKIENAIEQNILTKPEEYYTKRKFEHLLKEIGLDTVLIVHQKKDLSNNNGKHQSLSDSTSNPYEVIKVGYINALEFQKPHVQGILINNLKDFKGEVALITGSDCHDWRHYPKHNEKSEQNNFEHTVIKALPTFKGLHIALTSPNTRINRRENSNSNYINHISVGGEKILLDSGINAIVGENGSGKSTIMKLLADNISENYVKTLIKDSGLKVDKKLNRDRTKIIKQSEIIEKFNKDKLFGEHDGYFDEINNETFNNSYEKYQLELKKYIERNINQIQFIENLENMKLKIINDLGESTYYVTIHKSQDESLNIHTERKISLQAILTNLKLEYNTKYYSPKNKKLLGEMISQLHTIYLEILEEMIEAEFDAIVRNTITSSITDYNLITERKTNTKDSKIKEYKENKESFCNQIFQACKFETSPNEVPELPPTINGFSKKSANGFVFIKQSKYHAVNVISDFYKTMFNSGFTNIENIIKIKSKEQFFKAITNAKVDTINENWSKNFLKFKEEKCSTKSFIQEEKQGTNIGSTMGEISLVYYKYQLVQNDTWDILLIDQPEDNISNTKISSDLIQYINSMRDKKQVIFVTHNPLLVVNLDADNVICLEKTNNQIRAISGCLEDEVSGILDYIAENMEGGKEMIENRLKIYE